MCLKASFKNRHAIKTYRKKITNVYTHNKKPKQNKYTNKNALKKNKTKKPSVLFYCVENNQNAKKLMDECGRGWGCYKLLTGTGHTNKQK